jgi:hypothetical protein
VVDEYKISNRLLVEDIYVSDSSLLVCLPRLTTDYTGTAIRREQARGSHQIIGGGDPKEEVSVGVQIEGGNA